MKAESEMTISAHPKSPPLAALIAAHTMAEAGTALDVRQVSNSLDFA